MAAMSGCTLGSHDPLIEQPEVVPGLLDGQYQGYTLTDPAASRHKPWRVRRRCVSPGYVFDIADSDDRRVHRVQPIYCPGDDRAPVPMQIVRDGPGYRLTAPDQQLRLEFQRLRAGIYLMQVDDAKRGGLRYGYALAREAPGGIDLALLPCDSFPHLESVRETSASNVTKLCRVA
ncbi:hypothetical protein TS85_16620 [Sphingomonas hengshuiensis]|uniref:Uncharacterized protein n=1 Tax=Sphingomonas hengshuiensis TaxID=1609977 RepID=A0A7U4JA61_9SPHN|nr:hypothetical protein TS85_16620 [Sphingomonas hengshuiensis]